MKNNLLTPESKALAHVCLEWYVSIGIITLMVVLSFWIAPLWMPLVEMGVAVILALNNGSHHAASGKPCGQLTLMTIYTLMLTGLISFGIVLAYRTEFIHRFFDILTLNHSIPYITSLIIFPVCAAVSAISAMSPVAHRHARKCHLHNEYNPSQPMFSRIVHGTYRSLFRKSAVLTLIISVIDWAYYFLCYRNNTINSPDRFFFFIVPVAIYVWSVVYVRNAYSTLSLFNGRTIRVGADNGLEAAKPITNSVIVRFLIVRNDRLLLDVSEDRVMNCSVDTPVTEIKPDSYKGNVESARKDFEHRTGLNDFYIKLLYSTVEPLNNNKIYHFLITLPEDANADLLGGEWVDLTGINNLLNMGVLASPLAQEIFRIYTVTMAWKTYNRDGSRKYPVRNYKPTFRLSDLHKYDVDYEDRHWLRVSRINQDSRLWALRRFLL